MEEGKMFFMGGLIIYSSDSCVAGTTGRRYRSSRLLGSTEEGCWNRMKLVRSRWAVGALESEVILCVQ